jgi:hypothetical protein
MRSHEPGRVATALGAAALLAVTAAGCVSMPNGGPVLPYAVSPSGNGQAQPYLQFVPQPPIPNAEPADIVRGFLAASASFVGQQRVAREYLTPEASHAWRPGWSAIVFRNGPNVQHVVSTRISPSAHEKLSATASASPRPTRQPTATSSRAANTRSTVTVGGTVEASLSGPGTYAVPRPTPKGHSTYSYDLIMYHGQWRISRAPDTLLLTHTEFDADYQLRNLYFFDPSGQHLVPDPVYVPSQATQEDLVNGLVQDLIAQPTGDWLANGATQTAFPKGTRQLGRVTVDGSTASVNLGGAIAHSQTAVKLQVSAQLLWTLNGAGQGAQQVQSVALSVNGIPFVPPNAQGNPVQGIRSPAHQAYKPIVGPPDNDFYYIDSHGQLLHKDGLSASKPALVARIGTGYRSLAVSPDGDYFAVLRDGVVYTAPMGSGKLTLRDGGSGFTSLSWDRNDNLWAAGPMNVVMLPATPKPNGGSSPVAVVQYPSDTCPGTTGGVTELRIAPDGVRVALVIAGQQPMLAFGAIVVQDQSRAGQQQFLVQVNLSPFFVCGQPGAFRSLSWYGTDDVFALAQDGTALTEYPVNGGTQATIQGKAGTQSITARMGGGVIAGVGDTMFIDPGATGVWTAVGAGLSPAYPG